MNKFEWTCGKFYLGETECWKEGCASCLDAATLYYKKVPNIIDESCSATIDNRYLLDHGKPLYSPNLPEICAFAYTPQR